MKNAILLLILLVFSTASQAQYISCYGAKNNTTKSIDKYVIVTDCNLYNANKIARDSLIKLGFAENTYMLTSIGYLEASAGIYALIKYSGKDNYNVVKTTYGFGAAETEDEALSKARKSLGVNNWGWTEKLGYDRVEVKPFFTCAFTVVQYYLKMVNSGSCGSSIQTKTFTTKKVNSATDLPKQPHQYFIIPKNKSYVAAIELEYLCSPENTKYSEVKFLSAGSKDELVAQIVDQLILPKYSNLNNVYVMYMANAGADMTSNSGFLGEISKAVDQYLNKKLTESDEEYCRKKPLDCEKGKRIRRITCMCIRG